MLLSDTRHLTLSANARLFALMHIAAADGGIACWDAKYHYRFWRPVTAISLAATDGNSATGRPMRVGRRCLSRRRIRNIRRATPQLARPPQGYWRTISARTPLSA